MADRRAVVVLWHAPERDVRLCGALDLMGVDFRKHLLPDSDANEKGHWEHDGIVPLHDGLLSSLGPSLEDEV